MIEIGTKVIVIQVDRGEEEYMMAIGTVKFMYLNAIEVAFDDLNTRAFWYTQLQELNQITNTNDTDRTTQDH